MDHINFVFTKNRYTNQAFIVIQPWSHANGRFPVYEVKVLFSQGLAECTHAFMYTLELQQHYYHTSGLSKEIYYFVLSQGAQKLPAVKV